MTAIILPRQNWDITAANETVSNAPQRILMVGQQLGGTATSGSLVENVGTNGEEDTLFGYPSMLATMVKQFRKINTISQVDCIPLDDNGSAVDATATVTVTGTATESGTITMYVMSYTEDYKIEIAVTTGDDQDTIAANIATEINGNQNYLVDANTTLNVITLNCIQGGTVGNGLSMQVSNVPAGVTVALTAFSGGTTDPSLTNLFNVIEDIRYQTIVYPGNYDLAVLKTELAARENVDNNVLDGVGFVSISSDEGTLEATADTMNSKSIVILGNKAQTAESTYVGDALFEFSPTITAQFAAIRALRLTTGQDITPYLVGSNITNTTGGPDRAAYPYHNTPMPLLGVIQSNRGWSAAEQTVLNTEGVSFLGNNSALSSIIMGDMVTTYQSDSGGNADTTFKYLNAVDTSSTIREFYFNNNKERYAQTVLTTGVAVPGASQADVNTIAAYQTELYSILSNVGYALTVYGSAALTYFKDNLSVVITDSEAGLVTISAIVPIVTQLRAIDGTIRISFSITSS